MISRMVSDDLILALVVLVAVAFSLFEYGGLHSSPWHTISWYAHVDRWVDYLIGGLGVIALIIFEVWWHHHAASNIPR